MRPRRRDRKPQGQGSSSCLLSLRNPSLILNAGLLASALTNLAESGSTNNKNGKGNKEKEVVNNKENKKNRNSKQIQNGHLYTADSRSPSQTELSFGDENHQNVSKYYPKTFIYA